MEKIKTWLLKNWKLVVGAVVVLVVMKVGCNIYQGNTERYYKGELAKIEKKANESLVKIEREKEEVFKQAKIDAEKAKGRVDKIIQDTDRKISSIKVKTNAELKAAKATADEVLIEKKKVEKNIEILKDANEKLVAEFDLAQASHAAELETLRALMAESTTKWGIKETALKSEIRRLKSKPSKGRLLTVVAGGGLNLNGKWSFQVTGGVDLIELGKRAIIGIFK